MSLWKSVPHLENQKIHQTFQILLKADLTPLVNSNTFFNYYWAASWSTMGHYWGDSLTKPILSIAFWQFLPGRHREPCNEVWSLGLAECLVGFEPGTFQF